MFSNCIVDKFGIGDIFFLVYLFNLFIIVVCVGGLMFLIENMLIIFSLYGVVVGFKFFLIFFNMSIYCFGLFCIILYL